MNNYGSPAQDCCIHKYRCRSRSAARLAGSLHRRRLNDAWFPLDGGTLWRYRRAGTGADPRWNPVPTDKRRRMTLRSGNLSHPRRERSSSSSTNPGEILIRSCMGTIGRILRKMKPQEDKTDVHPTVFCPGPGPQFLPSWRCSNLRHH